MQGASRLLHCEKVSAFNAEGPPVPIPNTEVKLCSAEDTCLATGRENRSVLTHPSGAGFLQPDKSVFLTQRVHPFPFRTRKLSSAVPKILAWRRAGKIGQCRHKKIKKRRFFKELSLFYFYHFLIRSKGRLKNITFFNRPLTLPIGIPACCP